MQATLPILHFWKKKYLGNHFKRIPFKHNLLCSFPSIPWFLHRRVRVGSADSSHENKHSPPGQRSTETVDVLCFKTYRIPRKIHTELWISDGFWDRGCSLTAQKCFQMKTAAGAAELQAGVKVECWRLIFPSFIFPQPSKCPLPPPPPPTHYNSFACVWSLAAWTLPCKHNQSQRASFVSRLLQLTIIVCFMVISQQTRPVLRVQNEAAPAL